MDRWQRFAAGHEITAVRIDLAMMVSGNTTMGVLSPDGAARSHDLSWRTRMVGRALGLAAVMLGVCCFLNADLAQAQENLDAGKSPSQLFAGTCTACHKSPRGLLKTVAAGSLPGFLRQHYTTSPEMAGVLSSYLVSNGASDTRYMGNSPRGGKDGKDGAREAKSDAKSNARTEDAPASIVDQLDRFGRRLRPSRSAPEASESRETSSDRDSASSRNERAARSGRKRMAHPDTAPDAKQSSEDQSRTQATVERGADGRKSAGKQKLGKRGKRGTEEPARPDAAKDEPADAIKLDVPNGEAGKTEVARPAADDRAEPAQADLPKQSEPPASRTDSVTARSPVTTQSPSPVAGDSTGTVAVSAPPAATTAPLTLGPPVPPAGPPEPPISH